MAVRSRSPASSILRDAHETDPLLNDRPGSIASSSADHGRSRPKAGGSARRRLHLFALCVLLLTIGDFGIFLVTVPQTRLYESIACYRYYETHEPSRIGPGGSVREQWCKIAPVQAEVAFVRGYEALFTAIPGVALAIPYGLLADRWGRKPVVLMSMIGILLSMTFTLVVCGLWQIFPLRLVWLSPIFTVLGGGAPVLFSMIWTMIADVMPENERATAFFQLMTGQYVAQITATPIASGLMETHGPWLPIQLGYICAFMALLIACLLKETAPPRDADAARNPTGDGSTTTQSETSVRALLESKSRRELQAHLAALWRRATAVLRHDAKVIVLLLTFFINAVEEPTQSLNLQYISERYGLSLARAGFVISIKSVATIVTYVALLPAASWLLQQRLGLSDTRKDMVLARGSIVVLSAGFFLVAWSPTVAMATVGFVLSTFGRGYGNIIRSVVTSLVPAQFTGRMYTMITVIETFGLLLSGPLLAALFRVGLNQGDVRWLGLPFMVAGGIGVIVAVVISCLDVSTPAGAGEAEEADDDSAIAR
ncbi:putative MFS transporter [Aspergillus clavatus NRRL 1]|uniref:MFS transporter, putative n=1 Tax=Aspergillus clavatus (strain ATCC 1007 / CBS 513.65 / DSM 816 / NCTC 3887 / NRRL 1 / QM 1276 / 107) TaxID=344612 RepID=A1CMW1_ASPCL|nr:MFS transporter, putative [Aspergillus clavatus NRRL 1]EAW08898.1 MFS transporter, putative [Aspergillus clavatus NRRL 1]